MLFLLKFRHFFVQLTDCNSRYIRSDAGVNVNLETGINTGGHAQGDTLIGIEAVVGSNYNDVIIGGSNNDYISAAKGNDILNGGHGNDTLLGGAGNDLLSGDGGSDKLYGEAGADIFLFETSTLNGIDTIYDFSTAQGDQLSIVGLLQGYDPLQNAIDDFVNFTTFGANTTFTVDRDGTEAIYSSQIIATLNAITGLDADSLLASGNLLVV